MLTNIKYLIKIIWLSFFLTISVNANVILINNGFEEPVIGTTPPNPTNCWGNYICNYLEADVLGWETTASDDKIELWQNGNGTSDAYEGIQFTEIKAKLDGLKKCLPSIVKNSFCNRPKAIINIYNHKCGVTNMSITPIAVESEEKEK